VLGYIYIFLNMKVLQILHVVYKLFLSNRKCRIEFKLGLYAVTKYILRILKCVNIFVNVVYDF